MFYPYGYEEQIKGSERLAPMAFSKMEQQKIAAGENIFPHLLGTDQNGRDYMIRVLVGGRVSMTVGIVASVLILFIGSIYGAIAGYFGGMVDMIMMRIVDIIYTVPDVLIIILLAQTLKFPLEKLGAAPGFGWIEKLGPNMISMFIVFALLYDIFLVCSSLATFFILLLYVAHSLQSIGILNFCSLSATLVL